jgi:diphthamide biosynthesis methyltransferase
VTLKVEIVFVLVVGLVLIALCHVQIRITARDARKNV